MFGLHPAKICDATASPTAAFPRRDAEFRDAASSMERISDLPIEKIEKQQKKEEEGKRQYEPSSPTPSAPPIPTDDVNHVRTDEIQYPKLGVVAVMMIALYFAVLLVALVSGPALFLGNPEFMAESLQDRTIVATAIPRITDDFDSLGDVGWYGSAYLLTSSAFQLVFGRIYTFCSPKWVFLSSILIFEVGSAVCGAAPNSIIFILGRAIAGLGSAGIFSGSIILIVYMVPLNKRSIYTGSLGGVFAVASVAGPLLGGAFTKYVSWRWCFYINLPVGGITVAIVFFILNLPSTARAGSTLTLRQILHRLDPLGNALLLPSIVCLLLALQWGGTTYAWSDRRIIALLVLFGVLFIAFVALQIWKQDTATIPTHIIKQRSIAFATIFSFFVGASMISMIYYLPTWFQAIQGISALDSGIRNIPLLLATFTTSLLAGFIITKVGYYTPFMIVCSVIMSIGAGLITTFKSTGTSYSEWIGYQALYGIGLGLGSQQASLATQVVLARKDVPTGSSLIFFAQSLGGSIAVSIASNVFNSRLVTGLEDAKFPNLDPSAVVHAGAIELRNVVGPQNLALVLSIYNDALMDAFRVSLALACFSILGAAGVEFRSVKKQKKSTEKSSDVAQSDVEAVASESKEYV